MPDVVVPTWVEVMIIAYLATAIVTWVGMLAHQKRLDSDTNRHIQYIKRYKENQK